MAGLYSGLHIRYTDDYIRVYYLNLVIMPNLIPWKRPTFLIQISTASGNRRRQYYDFPSPLRRPHSPGPTGGDMAGGGLGWRGPGDLLGQRGILRRSALYRTSVACPRFYQTHQPTSKTTAMPLESSSIYGDPSPDQFKFPSRRSVVHSTEGIVSCTQPLAAKCGVEVLRAGGNAAVSARFCICRRCFANRHRMLP